MTGLRRIGLGLVAGVAGAALLAPGASAATINVTSDLDTPPAAGAGCTLREAVFVANTNEPSGGRGLGNLGCGGDAVEPDRIVLTGAHIYELTNTFAHEDENVWGDLDIKGPTTITTSSGMAQIQGKTTGDRDRVIHVNSTAGSVRLERLKITDGLLNLPGDVGGGGILADAPVTIVDSEVTGNRVQASNTNTQGGGIYVRGPLGTLTMTGSTVAGNVGQVAGAMGSGTQTIGGGISAYNAAPFVSITNSTISGNSSTGASGVGPGLVGGAFLGDGTASSPGNTTLVNNTITQNTATVGGAITGGLQVVNGTMRGNIVAANVADNDPQDCFGNPDSSGGGNLIGEAGLFGCDEFTAPNDLVGTYTTPVLANLGNLLNNGGLTRTHLPNQASPAVNRGGSCPATDQRGFFRFNVAPCDAGSVELGASVTPPPPPPPPPPTVTPTIVAPGPTGQRDAALAKCKKKKTKKAKKKCRKKANRLPL